MKRCAWVGHSELAIAYHDAEWGVPSHDDRTLFEMLILEGAQAGLSWNTILGKRAEYRRVYAGFDPRKVARFDKRKRERLLANPGIVRNRLKVESSVSNARAFLETQQEYGCFATYLWSFVDGEPVQNRWRSSKQLPSETDASRALSRDLKKRGFRFVGSTICYAYMQGVGMVNDHELSCFRHGEVATASRARAPRSRS